MTTLTPQTKQTGAGISIGMPIGLLLALTYAVQSGYAILTSQSKNSVSLTSQTKN